MITVAVAGALGRMGQEVSRAVQAAGDLQLVAGIDVRVPTPEVGVGSPESGSAPGLGTPDSDLGTYFLTNNLREAIERTHPEVLVDFTVAEAAISNAMTALEMGVRPVIGTTGMSQQQLADIEGLSRAKGVGAFVAPNFAIGAVLMMHFARVASRFFDAAEVIELHHDQKVDSPSGTAVKSAQDMAAARGRPFSNNVPTKEPLAGARGAEWEGVRIHAVRLPGLVAHQEVLFGGQGQTLTIRHDTTDRTAFIPGVLIAIREVPKVDHLVVGLDRLLGLGG